MIRAILAALAAATLTAAGPAPAHASPDNPAALRLDVTGELAEGQRITVNGTGFQHGIAAVAIGLCKEHFVNGLRDCDLEGGATFVNVAGDGTLPTVVLTARHRFGNIDCLEQQCVIAAAPLPGTEPPAIITANSASISIVFQGSRVPAPTTAPIVEARTVTDTRGPSTPLWGATAALLFTVAVLALIDRRRL
ncbi:neocarzinostatin apoprotein domain-containing protein [Nocardia jejuensis]|uniref:neocarzinostatin apoprotein domain-containing protein n=1 Tax=Nocardia jejuensis TaxID=328049 RepID=UPI0008310877|nr:neocarzinostatin apoprotein domain-containing protein [Nocardia jejuensis]